MTRVSRDDSGPFSKLVSLAGRRLSVPDGVFCALVGTRSRMAAGRGAEHRGLHRFLRRRFNRRPLARSRCGGRLSTAGAWLDLDEIADAFLTNAVANRASRIQGRTPGLDRRPRVALRCHGCRRRGAERGCAHVAPLWGVVFQPIGLPLDTARTGVLFGTAEESSRRRFVWASSVVTTRSGCNTMPAAIFLNCRTFRRARSR